MNREEHRAYCREWYKRNRQHARDYAIAWRGRNKENISEYNKKWKSENPNYQKEWKKINPELVIRYRKKYYDNMTGFEYNFFLLKCRRKQALARMRKRNKRRELNGSLSFQG